jgi:ankyrin repeat protein
VRAILRVRPELVNVVAAWNNEHTALRYAVLDRMAEMVRLLMRHGANARAGISPRNDATGALTIASERGYGEIVSIIRDEEKRRDNGGSAEDDVSEDLRQALRSGDEDRAIEILERLPRLINYQVPGHRRTLLHVAPAMLLRRVTAWLLHHGADPNLRSEDESTALEVAGHLCGGAERPEDVTAVVALLRDYGA